MIRVLIWCMVCLNALLAEAQTSSISGKVVDAYSGESIIRAPIYLIGTTRVVVSQEDGSYQVRDVKPGTYVITAASQGYVAQSDTIIVTGDSHLEHNFRLTPDQATRKDEANRLNRQDLKTIPRPAIDPGRSDTISQLSSVCGCFASAVRILNDAIRLRIGYEDVSQFEQDSDALEQMNALTNSWQTTQQVCLTRFGSKLLEDSTCNRPREISIKRRQLDDLGVRM